MNLNDDIVYGGLRLGAFQKRQPGPTRSLVHHDRLHPAPPCIQSSRLTISSTNSSFPGDPSIPDDPWPG
jgi:hypothetical protein